MTDSTTITSPAAEQPTWEKPAVNAYSSEQQARRRRQVESAATDIAALQAKLAELGLTPINEDHDSEPYQVAGDGTVTALIAQPDEASSERRRVWACARTGQLWLRATDDLEETIGDVEGELHTLADIGRALIEGPQPLTVPATNYDQAERRLRAAPPDCSADAVAICRALDGLTHAVLAVADELRDADLPAIGGTIERYIGGAR
jgi:hypothetical protein